MASSVGRACGACKAVKRSVCVAISSPAARRLELLLIDRVVGAVTDSGSSSSRSRVVHSGLDPAFRSWVYAPSSGRKRGVAPSFRPPAGPTFAAREAVDPPHGARPNWRSVAARLRLWCFASGSGVYAFCLYGGSESGALQGAGSGATGASMAGWWHFAANRPPSTRMLEWPLDVRDARPRVSVRDPPEGRQAPLGRDRACPPGRVLVP